MKGYQRILARHGSPKKEAHQRKVPKKKGNKRIYTKDIIG